METMGVVTATQGVVNQANSNSTHEPRVRIRENEPAHTDIVQVDIQPQAAEKLNARVEQILTRLKDEGAALAQTQEHNASQPAPRIDRSNYIEVLRDVLVGKTSVERLSFAQFTAHAASPDVTPKLPAYPFDRNFLKLNLQYLKALVSGDGGVDQQLAQRIESQLEALTRHADQNPAQTHAGLIEQVI